MSFSSFGRRSVEPEVEVEEDDVDQEGEELVVLPPVLMRPVQVPVVLTVDPTSLATISEQITTMVAAAVRAGFDRAAADDQ